MISMAYDPCRETARCGRRKMASVFAAFLRLLRPEAKWREIDVGLRAPCGGPSDCHDPTTASVSPRRRLGNGAASPWNRSKWTREMATWRSAKMAPLPAPSGVAGVGGKRPLVDAQDRERPIVF